MGSVGVYGCGEHNNNILMIPGISCKFPKGYNKLVVRQLKRCKSQGRLKDLQEVGLIRSSKEASNDRGAKELAQ